MVASSGKQEKQEMHCASCCYPIDGALSCWQELESEGQRDDASLLFLNESINNEGLAWSWVVTSYLICLLVYFGIVAFLLESGPARTGCSVCLQAMGYLRDIKRFSFSVFLMHPVFCGVLWVRCLLAVVLCNLAYMQEFQEYWTLIVHY